MARRLTQDEILAEAGALYRGVDEDLQALAAQKAQDLAHYDVRSMNRVTAILCWGRSGSVLLASHLDGCEDVLMLPALRSDGVYGFYELYPAMPLREKLLAYPVFTAHYDATSAEACGRSYFEGDFGISPAAYHAAVLAICSAFGDGPPEFLTSRRSFFLFVHIAYQLARGRRPAGPAPMIVCAQHGWDNRRARWLIDDFPRARFVHTIRDPISSFDRLFNWWFDPDLLPPTHPSREARAAVALGAQGARSISPIAPLTVVSSLVRTDGALAGMDARTRAVRFEDLHCNTAESLRALCEWLGIPYRAAMLESTFNGVPYVVAGEGKTWSGPRPEKAKRCSRNLSAKDRALVFALLHENFMQWGYACPPVFANRLARGVILLLLPLLPMKMELIAARAMIKRRVLPALKRGDLAVVVDSLLRVLYVRARIIGVTVREGSRRLAQGRKVLTVIGSGPETGVSLTAAQPPAQRLA